MSILLSILFFFIGAAWFFIVLHRFVERDFEKWKNNYQVVKHGWYSIKEKAVNLIPSSICFYIPLFSNGWWIISSIISIVFMQAFAWWLFFDGWYNRKRKFGWWFTGSHDETDDSGTDQFLEKLPKRWQIVLKVGGLVLFLSGYILLLIKFG